MKQSRVKAKVIAQKRTVQNTIAFILLFLIGLLLISLPTRAEQAQPNAQENTKPKDCSDQCNKVKIQCVSFCEETHENSDNIKSCEDKCDFVFDGYCRESCKADKKFSFSCLDEETNSDDLDCIDGCESHYANIALNCNEKNKDDIKARQECFENATSLVDDTGFCYSICATDPAYACEQK